MAAINGSKSPRSIKRATKPSSEAKADVEKAWRDEEAGKILLAKTADLTKKLDAGEPLASIAAAEGKLEIKHANDVRRNDGNAASRSMS